MIRNKKRRGFNLVETMVSVTIFGVAMYGIFQGMVEMQNSMRFETRKETVEGGATQFMEKLGRDLREASYAYIFAGDWTASRNLDGDVFIDVARNYFSSNFMLGGAALVPGISNEGWGQCPNALCDWSTIQDFNAPAPAIPNAYLVQPVRNNPQAILPIIPPPSFSFSAADARGRLFGNLGPGDICPNCGTMLVAEAFISGVLIFSPRRQDNTFSYNASGDEAQWESIIFYCPFINNQGLCEIRRYTFFASQVNANARLVDLMDFDGDDVIASPPMTDPDGSFLLDAEWETFGLVNNAGGVNQLQYARWDNAAGRFFMIQVDRATGMAFVLVTGGPYDLFGGQVVPLEMERFASGLSDFEVSTYINNPSWEVGGAIVNPLGVMELEAVRVTFQVDRELTRQTEKVETVQSTMVRPRN